MGDGGQLDSVKGRDGLKKVGNHDRALDHKSLFYLLCNGLVAGRFLHAAGDLWGMDDLRASTGFCYSFLWEVMMRELR